MKKAIILLLIVYCTSLSYYECESALSPTHNPITKEESSKGGAYELSEIKSKRKGLIEGEDEIDIKSYQKGGKGVNGGNSDVVRPPKPRNGTTSLLFNSSSYLFVLGFFISILFFSLPT